MWFDSTSYPNDWLHFLGSLDLCLVYANIFQNGGSAQSSVLCSRCSRAPFTHPSPSLDFFRNNRFCQRFWELETNNGYVHAGCKNIAKWRHKKSINNVPSLFERNGILYLLTPSQNGCEWIRRLLMDTIICFVQHASVLKQQEIFWVLQCSGETPHTSSTSTRSHLEPAVQPVWVREILIGSMHSLSLPCVCLRKYFDWIAFRPSKCMHRTINVKAGIMTARTHLQKRRVSHTSTWAAVAWQGTKYIHRIQNGRAISRLKPSGWILNPLQQPAKTERVVNGSFSPYLSVHGSVCELRTLIGRYRKISEDHWTIQNSFLSELLDLSKFATLQRLCLRTISRLPLRFPSDNRRLYIDTRKIKDHALLFP